MRLAYVSADLGVPAFGQKGCSRHVQEILRGFLNTGTTIDLYAARIGGCPPADLTLVRACEWITATTQAIEDREQRGITANADLLEHLLSQPIYDAIYERYSLWGFAAMEYGRMMGIPSVLEVNAPLIDEQRRHRGLNRIACAEAIAARTFAAASAIVAVSDGVADYLKAQGVAESKVHVVPNGVDPDQFLPIANPTQADSLEHHPFTIGFVGTLKPWHGVAELLQAFLEFHNRHPKSRLLIVGDGPERAGLQEELQRWNIDAVAAVTWVGAVAPSEIPSFIAQMDIAVAPYPQLEQFYFSPLKVFEYMAAARAVVASDIGQLRDIVRHEQNGLLVAAGCTKALTAAIQRLYEAPDMASRLGQAARETILANHSWESVVQRVLAIMQHNPSPPQRSRKSTRARNAFCK
ncbi:MAG: glycosyltransferase [Pirellulaceae bacterium]